MVKIEFASTKFNGSESSGEILVNILVTGAITIDDINVMINLSEGTATS